MYQVRDAEEYRGKKILCVGGGDSAIEAAMGLARQAGNELTLSYRGEAFDRVKAKNLETLDKLVRRGKIRPLLGSEVLEIGRDQVRLRTAEGEISIDNDYVFVLIGGEPPFPFLRSIGVRFGDELQAQRQATHQNARAMASAAQPRVGCRSSPVGALLLLVAWRLQVQTTRAARPPPLRPAPAPGSKAAGLRDPRPLLGRAAGGPYPDAPRRPERRASSPSAWSARAASPPPRASSTGRPPNASSASPLRATRTGSRAGCAAARTNLTLDYRGTAGQTIGWVLLRGESRPRAASDARVVLRQRGGRYFVLTSYPVEP